MTASALFFGRHCKDLLHPSSKGTEGGERTWPAAIPATRPFLIASGWIAARTAPLWLALATTAVTLAFVAGVFWVIRRLNHIAAQRLDREIRDIDAQR